MPSKPSNSHLNTRRLRAAAIQQQRNQGAAAEVWVTQGVLKVKTKTKTKTRTDKKFYVDTMCAEVKT